MIRVLTAAASRGLDNHMMRDVGIPGIMLMENAASAVAEVIGIPDSAVLILCGSGNNGGDGIAIYRRLAQEGADVSLLFLSDPEELTGDAKAHFSIIKNAGLPFTVADKESDLVSAFASKRYGVIVDAIFGTGLTRRVEGMFAAAIRMANEYDALRVAVDIPSGIEADTGAALGEAFRAHKTVTFQCAKRGHLLYPGREHTGALFVRPIGMAAPDYDYGSNEHYLEQKDVQALLPRRKADAHKGDNGRALLIAGSHDMPGAAVLAAESALRAGAGLLNVFCPGETARALHTRLPEAMTCAFDGDWRDALRDQRLIELLDGADCVGIGCGMGKSDGVSDVLAAVLQTRKPAVIDADAINALSRDCSLIPLLHDKLILTPHPGEAGRLASRDTAEIAARPAEFALEHSKRLGVTLLLKGATSVICSPNGRTTYNLTGNAGLAKGGSGDVLTGIILGLMAQGHAPHNAAAVGSYLLGISADAALTALGERALLATDVSSGIFHSPLYI